MDLIGLILGILLAVIDKIKGNTLSKVSKKKTSMDTINS